MTRDDRRSESVSNVLSARRTDRRVRSQDRLHRDRAHADDDAGLEVCELGVEPRPAGFDFAGARLLMDAPLAAFARSCRPAAGCQLKCLTAFVR